jgi:hypothetical protein
LAAFTLKINNAWRTSHNSFVAMLEQAENQERQLLGNAGPDTRGLRQAKRELHAVTVGRGHVWAGVVPGEPDASGAVSVTVENPQPHQIVENMVLYAFDERPQADGGGYLGEFKVAQVAEQQVALTPGSKLSDAQITRLQQATGPWRLYDVMPPDSHQVLAELSEEELKALMPGADIAEYLKDGKPAEANDPPERVVDDKYVRQLRDYAVLFREYQRLHSQYIDLIAAAEHDKQYIENALADTQRDAEFRKQEIADLEAQLAKFSAERDAVVAFRESLDKALADTQALIAELSAANKKLAARYAAWQIESARRVDEAAAQALGARPRPN